MDAPALSRGGAARLLVDCTHMLAGRHYSGIQRYVRHTLRQAAALLGTARVGAIAAGADGWRNHARLPAHPMEGLGPVALAPGHEARFTRDCHVLLADRFWHTGAWETLEQLLRSEAGITLVVYDLLSLRHPNWFSPGVGERFGRYLRLVLPRAGRVVCLSRVVANELGQWASQQGLTLPPLCVVAPGHRVWQGAPAAPALLPKSWRDGSRRFALQVGTLEPRKNHALTLEVLRRHWSRGGSCGALFIGQRGWLMEGFAQQLAGLPQWQRDLIWLTECTDAQLDWCYRHAAAVFYPSASEGYGLPLAEAGAAGAPVIASNTAVHREVVAQMGPDCAVRLCEARAEPMAHAFEQVLSGEIGRPPRPAGARTWHEATTELLEAMGFEIRR